MVCARSGSYSVRIAACAKMSVLPRLAGCCGFPSTLVGRPWEAARRDRMAEKSIFCSRLSVTGRTARELRRPGDLVFLHQPVADPGIVRRALVRHVEDLVPRPHELLRVPVALEAPAHLE